MHWELRLLPAAEIIGASVPWSDGQERVEGVAADVDYWIGVYRQQHGADVWNGTWKVPPYFVEGSLMDPPDDRLHLIEVIRVWAY